MPNKISQPLTSPLPKKLGTTYVRPEWLLTLPFNQEIKPSLHWLDEENLILGMYHKIELINVKRAERILLNEGENSKPSPNGKWIAFIKKINNKKQLFLMKNNGTEITSLTNFEKGLTGWFGYHYGFSWSPCSNYLTLHYQTYWDHVENDDNFKGKPVRNEIALINIHKKSNEIILTIDNSIRRLKYSPDGKKLFFMSDRIGTYYNESDDKTWIYWINLQDKSLKKLIEFEGLQQRLNPIPSPNNKYIAFEYDAEHPLFNFMSSIGFVEVQGEKTNTSNDVIRLTYQIKLNFPKWSNNSESIYALRDYGAYRQIYSININNGNISQITNSPLNIEDFSISPNNSRLAWIGQDCHDNFIIRLASLHGKNVRDIAIISVIPKEMALSEIKEIEWVVPHHPEKMRGLLILPLDYKLHECCPLIVDIHGGGPGARILLRGSILVNSPLEWQVWAAKGYAVLVPEFRSSSSFGSLDPKKMPDLINDDISDILAGVDSLVKQKIVDENNMAVIGHSAGARRVNWLIVSSHKFKAAISKEGWADEWFTLGMEDRKLIYSFYGGHPSQSPKNYQKNSALFHAQGATTPTLFLMGNPRKGGVDQYDTVRWLYLALKSQGIDSEYVQYPEEGHNFTKITTQRDALERVINWIDKHFKTEAS